MNNDVDAAHARLRSHQASLDSINSRVDGNERRLDRLEKRMDDQFYALSELKATASATQKDVHSQSALIERSISRVDYMAKRLDEHTAAEIKGQQEQTTQLERLHRTLIRGVTVLAVIATLLVVLTQETQLLAALMSVLGG